MKRKLMLLACGAVLLLGLASCARISTDEDASRFTALQSLPLEYGQLKSVTSTEQYPGWAQLWFQDDAGTIRMVRINWATDQMLTKTLTITRSAGGN